MKKGGQFRSLLTRFVGFLVLWIVLTEGDMHQFWLGLGFVLLATTSILWLEKLEESQLWPHPRTLMSYLAYFIYHSLKGGIDVTRRAFRFSRNVSPTYMKYPLRIPAESENARILFAVSICLFPGSLSCAFRENILIIQVLDEELANMDSIVKLESLVASLFLITLPPSIK